MRLQSDRSALAGLRVLEIAPGEAGATTRLLAELGADVITVPMPAPSEDPLAALAGSTGKRILRLDPGVQPGLDQLAELGAHADIVIETRLDSHAPEVLDNAFVAQLRHRNPTVVTVTVSPFGQNNDYSGWQLTSTVAEALSGVLARSGWPGRAPLPPPDEFALQCAYNQATWIVLVSYFNRLRTGRGDLIDIALLQAASQALDPGFGMGGSATAGVPASELPRDRPDVGHYYPVLPCKDGHVRICVLAPRQWQAMFEWMGRPEKYADSEFNKLWIRFKSDSLLPDIASLFASRTRAELELELLACGVPMAPVLTLNEAIDTEQFRERQATFRVPDGKGAQIRLPNGLVEVDGVRAGASAPLEIGTDAKWSQAERFMPAPEAQAPLRPLSGLTVLDLGVIIAGGEQSRLFADQGATTLKIENKAFPDGGRQSQNGEPVSTNFAMGHRNKLGLGLNLRHPEGKALFVDLARQADIVLSNFKPGTLASLGLDYESVASINPEIIYGDSSAYGPNGPWSTRPGYGPLVRSSSGLTCLWAYPGEPGAFSDAMTTYPDHISGRIVATATLALLIRRMRTGKGGETSLAQSEVITSHLAARIARHSVDRNCAARPDAPWGCYPCVGDDEWCAITVRNDADWAQLAKAIDRPDLAARANLANNAGRLAAVKELDGALEAWTRSRDPDTVMRLLQAAGVPAGRMLRVFELPDFDWVRQREMLREGRHPRIELSFPMEFALCQSEALPGPDFAPAPVPGEHSVEIISERLGLTKEAIARLLADGVLETAA